MDCRHLQLWLCVWQVGVCGEQGGEPSSVAFFARVGLDYVSCSPFRYEQTSLFVGNSRARQLTTAKAREHCKHPICVGLPTFGMVLLML